MIVMNSHILEYIAIEPMSHRIEYIQAGFQKECESACDTGVFTNNNQEVRISNGGWGKLVIPFLTSLRVRSHHYVWEPASVDWHLTRRTMGER